MGSAILYIFNTVIGLVKLVVIVSAILSWLIAFDVINVRNTTVYRFVSALDAVTRPLLAPIRRFIPSFGGIDISPIVLLILLQALQILVDRTLAPLLITYLN